LRATAGFDCLAKAAFSIEEDDAVAVPLTKALAAAASEVGLTGAGISVGLAGPSGLLNIFPGVSLRGKRGLFVIGESVDARAGRLFASIGERIFARELAVGARRREEVTPGLRVAVLFEVAADERALGGDLNVVDDTVAPARL
jgi:hypothetical protein